MTEYYIVRDRIEDMMNHLGASVNSFVWDVVERRVDGFIDHLNDTIEKIIENPGWEEEGNREIRDYAELLELHITSLDYNEVPESQENEITPEALEIVKRAIDEYIIASLPDLSTKPGRRKKRPLEELVKEVEDYIEYHNSQIKNVTQVTLRSILDTWYEEHRDLVEDIDSVYRDVAININLLDDAIDNFLEGPDAHTRIESYMARYNDQLFDIIAGSDRTNRLDDLETLDDSLLSLMLELRWISGPRDLPDSIMMDLLSLRDTSPELHDEFLSTGIELDDLIMNYDSIEVGERLKKRLEESLARRK